ncbi:MAG TPA: carboxypeptidase regulatory-like domain-containing protein, partial [Vicinamibacterales bacterium]|nr:carboxypeptidase regulatory-like domain-containing protein [Vicinamibacterales bacterium]
IGLFPTSVGAQGPTGRIEGVVHDAQGGVLPGATMTLRNQDTGVSRTLVTESDGRYLFPALGPGRYEIQAELSGFATQQVRDITITIGFERRLDITMAVQTLQETVTVHGEAPVVDTTNAEISGVVTQEQIATLPINSRQYLSLALLVPGTTVDATRSFFATVNVGGSMTFNGTGNVVDGMINNWAEDGEPRQDVPEDSVEEFKVTNASYKAEFGLATGGVVQVVTKSGTNALRGTAFEYFRDKKLNAKGIFESTKPDYRRHQFGGSAGGPVRLNRVHFFGAFERTDTEEFYTVRTGQPQFYSALEGTFPLPSFRNLYSARLDWQINNAQSAFARYLHEDEKKACQGCGGTSASGRDEEIPRRSMVAGHTWVRGTRHLNDFRFQYAYAAFYGYPGSTASWSQTGQFPDERLKRSTRQYRFPSVSYGNNYDYISPEKRWGLRDTYSINSSRHDVKIGGEFDYMPYVSEDALNLAATGGTYTFTVDQPFDPSNPATIAALTGASNFSATSDPTTVSHPTKYYVAFLQDDWRVAPTVTVNLGLRYERLYGNANEDLDPNAFPVPLPYVEVSRRGDKNNFGPRTGVAWDIQGDGSTVVRGAYGLYYGHIRLLGTLPEFTNFKTFTLTINNPGYPDPFGGRNPREFVASSPTPNINVVANDMVQPLSHQVSLGLSRKLTSVFALHVDAVYNRTKGDYKQLDINAQDPVTRLRPLTQFGRITQIRPDTDLRYKAIYTKLEKRFSRNNQFMVSYTFTDSDDNSPMGRYLDPFDLSLDWGPSNGERRHVVVASGSVRLPWDVTLGTLWTYRTQLPWSATAGRDLNGDGFASDLVPGTTRNSGSRNLNLEAVNAYRQANRLTSIAESDVDSSRINVLDMRVGKALRFGDRKIDLIAQAFNLLNTRNLQAQFGSGRVGNALSASFGRILSARPARQVELAIRANW